MVAEDGMTPLLKIDASIYQVGSIGNNNDAGRQPIYDIFIDYEIVFPISQDLLAQLKQFLDSCTLGGRYPDGNFFCPTRDCELNKITIAKFPEKKKALVPSGGGRVGGHGGERGRGRNSS